MYQRPIFHPKYSEDKEKGQHVQISAQNQVQSSVVQKMADPLRTT